MTAKPSSTPKDLYLEILHQLGVEERPSTRLYHLIRKIAYILNEDSLPKLIIIDEGGKQTPKKMEYLHELKDEISLTTGIILSGPPKFELDMREWLRKGLRGIDEFFRRIDEWAHLKTLNRDDIHGFVTAHGIDDAEFIQEMYSHTKYCSIKRRIIHYYRTK